MRVWRESYHDSASSGGSRLFSSGAIRHDARMSTTDARDAWRARAEAERKGRPPEELDWQTPDGIRIPAATFPSDVGELAHLGARGLLTQRPRPEGGWSVRALVSDADPSAAGARAARALDHGADEVEFVFDALAQDASDPHPESENDVEFGGSSAPGQGGVAVARSEDFDALLQPIVDRDAPLWFAAGEGSLAVLAWLGRRLSDEQLSKLAGGVDFDPIARMTMRRAGLADDGSAAFARHASKDSVFDELARVVSEWSKLAPGFRTLALDGQAYHLIGGQPALEIAATLATAIETARGLGAHGIDFDTLAKASSIRVQVDHEFLTQIAKLRALRLLWAKVATAFGGSETSLFPHVVAVSSARARADQFDQRTNLIRSGIASAAGVLGGADSVVATPFVESPDSHAFDLALDQQNLLRHESGFGRVVDPVGGSHSLELLTDGLARRAWELVQTIEAKGGLLKVIEEGWLGETVRAQESMREKQFRTGKRLLVGIHRFVDQELGGVAPEAGVDDEAEQRFGEERIAAFANWSSGRGEVPNLRASLESGSGLTDAFRAEGVDKLSLAELSTATWPSEDTRFEHRFLPVATGDGSDIEELREVATNVEPRPAALCLTLDQAAGTRRSRDLIADRLRTGGIQVEDHSPYADSEAVERAVVEQRPDVVILAGEPADIARLCDTLDRVRHEPRAVRIAEGDLPDALESRVDLQLKNGDDFVGFVGGLLHALGVPFDDGEGDE